MRKPEIATGYMSAFLARSDSILLSLYLVLWVYHYSHHDYDKANSRASALSGITYTVIMLTCIVYGLLLGNKNVLFSSFRSTREILLSPCLFWP